jgi:hypothetical protein
MFVELLAIVAALRTIPLRISAVIYTDSKSAIDAFDGFDLLSVTRRHLRCPVRALLRCLVLIVRERSALRASTRFLHVKAHTDDNDHISCGNRAVDTLARCALKESLPPEMCGSLWVPDVHPSDLPFQMWISLPLVRSLSPLMALRFSLPPGPHALWPLLQRRNVLMFLGILALLPVALCSPVSPLSVPSLTPRVRLPVPPATRWL